MEIIGPQENNDAQRNANSSLEDNDAEESQPSKDATQPASNKRRLFNSDENAAKRSRMVSKKKFSIN